MGLDQVGDRQRADAGTVAHRRAARLPVTFFLAEAVPGSGLTELEPDRDWCALQCGERAWVLQTYLRLAAAGAPVELTAAPRPGVVVYHAKQWRQLERRLVNPDGYVLVAVRGDVRSAPNADFEIVQNPAAEGGRRLYVAHWPQPGLLPRDAGRGDAVARAVYKGVRASLHPDLRDPAWAAALGSLGIAWEADELADDAPAAARAALRWPDYRDADAIVALRPPDRGLHRAKPATKLHNAWLAGVPAVLGPESAYRAERRSELDYLEVADGREALAAVVRLARDPGLSRAMVERGRERAATVAPEALADRWQELLFTTLPELVAGHLFRRHRRPPRRARLLAGRLRRLLAGR